MTILDFSPNLDIRNTAQLPRGTGCRYLLCIRGEGESLVAERWCRKRPVKASAEKVLVLFNGAK